MHNCKYWMTLAISRANLKTSVILRNISAFSRNFHEIFFSVFPDLLRSRRFTYPAKSSNQSGPRLKFIQKLSNCLATAEAQIKNFEKI